MKAVKFEQSNVTFAKDQPEYNQLPAHQTADGEVTSCWELTADEINEIASTGKIYLTLLTFNKGLSPVRLTVENPLK